MEEVQVRAPGRPRDDATGPALMEAARRLVLRHGYGAVSIQQIVSEAGVAKQTLYRRWPSKAELVLDAFLESAAAIPIPETGSVGEVLRGYLTNLFCYLDKDGIAIRSFIASAQDDPTFLDSFRSRFAEPRGEVVAQILKEAQRQGALPSDGDLAMAVETLHGAFWYRLLQNQPLDASVAKRLSTFILRGLGCAS